MYNFPLSLSLFLSYEVQSCKTQRAGLGDVRVGELAEWLRSGLQIRLHRFESGTRLQLPRNALTPRRTGSGFVRCALRRTQRISPPRML